jgi:DNA transformation protein and related proteins
MPSSSPYVEFLKEQFSSLGDITARAMFGGYALYCDGIVFGLVADNALYLKADDENRPRFTERRLKAFKPFPDRDEVMSYYEAPADIFEDTDAMRDWCAASVEAGKRGAKKKLPKNRKSR